MNQSITNVTSHFTPAASLAAQETDEAQRARCLVRFDAGGGSLFNFNTLLGQSYEIIGRIPDVSGECNGSRSLTVYSALCTTHYPSPTVNV